MLPKPTSARRKVGVPQISAKVGGSRRLSDCAQLVTA